MVPRSSAMEYTFTLKYQLADDDRDTDALVERLGEAGCDDALAGIGQPGRLALEFTREATDASIGNTWYFFASSMNIALSSLTLSGCWSAMSLD